MGGELNAQASARPSEMRRCGPIILTAVAAMALVEPGIAAAEEARPARAEAATQRGEGAIRFNIPTQPLDAALSAFGAATGVQIVYDSGLTAGLRSAAVV